MGASHLEPNQAQVAMIRGDKDDGPIVALNLNRYREWAVYPEGTADADVSGREAYARYGMVALQAILHVGGKIVWMANVQDLAIGCEHDRYDEVVAVWYPQAFFSRRADGFPGIR